MFLRNPRPVMNTSSTKRINSKTKFLAATSVHVNHVAKVVDVTGDIVVPMRRRGAQRLRMGNSFYSLEFGSQQSVRVCLNPTSNCVVRRPAIRRVIFEPTVMRRIMRGRDDNPVCQSLFTPAIVSQNRVRIYRGRRIFVPFGEHHVDAICRQHFQRGSAGWNGKRVCVNAKIQWTGYIMPLAIQANRLGNRKDVPFVEGQIERRSAMPGSAKYHSLFRHRRVRNTGVEGRDKPRHVNQYSGWCRFSCQRTYIHDLSFGGLFSSSVTFANRRRKRAAPVNRAARNVCTNSQASA